MRFVGPIYARNLDLCRIGYVDSDLPTWPISAVEIAGFLAAGDADPYLSGFLCSAGASYWDSGDFAAELADSKLSALTRNS